MSSLEIPLKWVKGRSHSFADQSDRPIFMGKFVVLAQHSQSRIGEASYLML
ncbi:hypothetical protein LC609_31345 [Nostoc sp. XA013]|nr:hypothetical protein [Nostoc sp. XA013]